MLTASGCSWFRKDKGAYAEAPEDRPLEVPPDLDRPSTEGAMKLPPAAGQSVTPPQVAQVIAALIDACDGPVPEEV